MEYHSSRQQHRSSKKASGDIPVQRQETAHFLPIVFSRFYSFFLRVSISMNHVSMPVVLCLPDQIRKKPRLRSKKPNQSAKESLPSIEFPRGSLWVRECRCRAVGMLCRLSLERSCCSVRKLTWGGATMAIIPCDADLRGSGVSTSTLRHVGSL